MPTELQITLQPAIELLLTTTDPINITYNEDQEPLFVTWLGRTFSYGEKATGVDSGQLWDQSIDDDYLYICVYGGEVGVAQWRRMTLFKT